MSHAISKAALAKIVWTPNMESAFINVRETVANSFLLTIPLPEDTMSIVTDASGKVFYRYDERISGKQQHSAPGRPGEQSTDTLLRN